MDADEHFEANVALVLRKDVLPAIALGRVPVRSSQNRVLGRVALLARAPQLPVAEPAAGQLTLRRRGVIDAGRENKKDMNGGANLKMCKSRAHEAETTHV